MLSYSSPKLQGKHELQYNDYCTLRCRKYSLIVIKFKSTADCGTVTGMSASLEKLGQELLLSIVVFEHLHSEVVLGAVHGAEWKRLAGVGFSIFLLRSCLSAKAHSSLSVDPASKQAFISLPSYYNLTLSRPLPADCGWNSGDPGSNPGLGGSTGERIDYPLQYSWASLLAQLVKNPHAMQVTWALSLSWEDPLENGKATHSSILAWRISWTVYSMGSQRVGHDWATVTHSF